MQEGGEKETSVVFWILEDGFGEDDEGLDTIVWVLTGAEERGAN